MKNRSILKFGIFFICVMFSAPFTTSSEAKTIKIGQINWLGYAPGMSAQKAVNVMIKMINDKGGLNVGGEKYMVEAIQYNSENNQAKAQAAVNRLIFEDKVKFIIGDSS